MIGAHLSVIRDQPAQLAAGAPINTSSELDAISGEAQGGSVSTSLGVSTAWATLGTALTPGMYHCYLVGLDPTNEVEFVTTSSATPSLAGTFGSVGTRYTTGVVFLVSILAARPRLSARTASGSGLTLVLTRVS